MQAELAAAEQDWQGWVIVCSRVCEVLAPVDESGQGHAQAARTALAAEGQPGKTSSEPRAARPKSQVPVWRVGLAWSVLSVDYQRILRALADRVRLGQDPGSWQELAACFGMEMVPARVEALRSKAKRLLARGWLAEPAPGRFTLAKGVTGPGGGS
ncbi:hypothetical protein [Streptomyces sp. NPDC007205]|uniref:hypothetical protein n=1 Tax=Streptomyces sp. NPDC007205 TaxID=3154316 RepID=UPI0033C48096